MEKLRILAIAILLLCTGCTHYISEQSRALADRSITFDMLREDPDAYRGKFVMLGGTVATVTRTREGTQLEVVQYNTDSRELPDAVTPSGGRFLATTSEVLDPAIYKPGALVTMMGEVAGKKAHPLQGVLYTYPVIAVKEIRALKFEELSPRWWGIPAK
jgi:outer membrane lipoprotein